MSRIEAIKSAVMPRLRLARMNLKAGIREAREINRENNVFKNIKDLITDIKEEGKNGEVFTAGVVDDKAKQMIETSRSGLERYAKINNINICFSNPQHGEAGFSSFEKPLDIIVDSKGGVFGNNYIERRIIDGDTDKVTQFVTEKKYNSKDGSTQYVKSTQDETFLRRAYRTIDEMLGRIDTEKGEDRAASFWG